MRARPAPVDLRVTLLAEPSLWCWEIVDGQRDGALVSSSWTSEWMAYDTRQEALTAGRRRLSELRAAAGARGSRRKGASAA